MAQAQGRPSTRAVDSLSANNEKTLGENQRIVQTDDGVFLYTMREQGFESGRRVDSDSDADHASKGGPIWWKALLKQQAERDKKSAPKQPVAKKVKNDE